MIFSLRRKEIAVVTRGTRSQKVSRFARFSLVATVLLVASFADHLQSRSFAPGQSAQSAISVKTELVRLPVSVTDASGNDNPVSVGLVVDHSRSMGAKLLAVAAAVAVFAHSSNPQDEMFVVDFNDDATVELMDGKAFTSDASELSKAARAVAARGRTALYDAVA